VSSAYIGHIRCGVVIDFISINGGNNNNIIDKDYSQASNFILLKKRLREWILA
jgi:hypothetical protein